MDFHSSELDYSLENQRGINRREFLKFLGALGGSFVMPNVTKFNLEYPLDFSNLPNLMTNPEFWRRFTPLQHKSEEYEGWNINDKWEHNACGSAVITTILRLFEAYRLGKIVVPSQITIGSVISLLLSYNSFISPSGLVHPFIERDGQMFPVSVIEALRCVFGVNAFPLRDFNLGEFSVYPPFTLQEWKELVPEMQEIFRAGGVVIALLIKAGKTNHFVIFTHAEEDGTVFIVDNKGQTRDGYIEETTLQKLGYSENSGIQRLIGVMPADDIAHEILSLQVEELP
jgi:hypothetical protein